MYVSTHKPIRFCLSHMLPVVSVNIAKGKSNVQVKCLLDTGSQRSYLTAEIIEQLKCDSELISEVNFDIKIFLGAQQRVLRESVFDVTFPNPRKLPLPMLIDDNLNITLNVANIKTAVSNIQNVGHVPADDTLLDLNDDQIFLNGLLGVDFLQSFCCLELVPCLAGSA